jgi:hypothetical protein
VRGAPKPTVVLRSDDGVETAEEASTLRRLGIECGQEHQERVADRQGLPAALGLQEIDRVLFGRCPAGGKVRIATTALVCRVAIDARGGRRKPDIAGGAERLEKAWTPIGTKVPSYRPVPPLRR